MPQTIATICKEHFAGQFFTSADRKMAGRKLKNGGVEAAIGYLTEKSRTEPPNNFQPPAKCDIIAQSRPYEEWPIYQASVAIQAYVYGLTAEQRVACDPGKSSASHREWFAKTGVDTCGYTTVQGLNKIFQNAFGRFDGVVKKVENRNKKVRDRIDRINEARTERGEEPKPYAAEESPYDRCGHLLHPPGINASIYLYQAVSPEPFVQAKFPEIAAQLPVEYRRGTDPNGAVPLLGDRLKIPEGERGYVPAWQRGECNCERCLGKESHSLLSGKPSRRRRAWYSRRGRASVPEALRQASARKALLVLSVIGDDWVVMDVRGLLRNARWRGLATPSTSLNDLIRQDVLLGKPKGLFTGDPVLDPRKGVATFVYKSDYATARTKHTLRGAAATKKVLLGMTETREVGLVSIDLGQTNPIAYEVSRVRQSDDGLVAHSLRQDFLPPDLIVKIGAYRTAYDRMEERLREEAVLSLTPEQQAEIRHVTTGAAGSTKGLLIEKVGEALPWEQMTSNTTFISDALQKMGETDVFIKEGVIRRDRGWAAYLRPRLMVETRQALNERLWDLKRQSSGYGKLSLRKTELARQCANYVVNETKKLTQCDEAVFVVEDLNMKFFHGGGKRDVGWNNFFAPKRENRWFIQVLHKAFCDLAQHRGMRVAEVEAARTSMTCPECGHCDSGNRDDPNRERFVCQNQKCGRTFHADREVATRNLTKVAIRGAAMPKPVCERSGDVENPGAARTAKSQGKSARGTGKGGPTQGQEEHRSQSGA